MICSGSMEEEIVVEHLPESTQNTYKVVLMLKSFILFALMINYFVVKDAWPNKSKIEPCTPQTLPIKGQQTLGVLQGDYARYPEITSKISLRQ